MAAVADQLGSLGSQVRAARAEAERLDRDAQSLQTALAADTTALAEADEALQRVESQPGAEEPLEDRREPLGEAVRAAHAREMEVRLSLRTDEERAAAVARRAEELSGAARRARRAAEERQRRLARQRRQREIAAAVRSVAEVGEDHSGRLLAAADRRRQEHEEGRGQRDRELAALRGSIRQLSQTLEDLTSSVHRDEMVRTEQRLKIQQHEERAMAEFGIEPDALVADYGPQVLIPPSPRAPGDAEDGPDDAAPYPFERGEQERRLRSAERALSLLGRVNPLALEEFAALEERHQFLSAQLDDLRSSRDDLRGIIKEVDDRMEQVFAEAFADTAVQFERVFARLFPGGAGRLVLTDPGDMLTTGVEVEARPPGKKVKRLSLLSGGERSLTAVAFLVALFKARPSPFYVLDEVEAALDDTNLGRLLEVIEELRADSQLIVITHQKRTMESADALYGVTMRGDGVSHVISQRIRESAPA
jgi:chromosome segregation protein